MVRKLTPHGRLFSLVKSRVAFGDWRVGRVGCPLTQACGYPSDIFGEPFLTTMRRLGGPFRFNAAEWDRYARKRTDRNKGIVSKSVLRAFLRRK